MAYLFLSEKKIIPQLKYVNKFYDDDPDTAREYFLTICKNNKNNLKHIYRLIIKHNLYNLHHITQLTEFALTHVDILYYWNRERNTKRNNYEIYNSIFPVFAGINDVKDGNPIIFTLLPALTINVLILMHELDGLDIHVKNAKGANLLSVVNDKEIVQYLVSKKIDMYERDNERELPVTSNETLAEMYAETMSDLIDINQDLKNIILAKYVSIVTNKL